MTTNIHIVIEKKTAYGWVPATTPQPDTFWAHQVPEASVEDVRSKLTSYLKAHGRNPLIRKMSPPTDRKELCAFLDYEFSPDGGSLLFGDEPWFNWQVGTPGYFEFPCYPFFAILADVRNDKGLTPISAPRGLPVDVSSETEDYLWTYTGAHGISHVYASELNAYPWKTQAPLFDHNPGFEEGIGKTRLFRMLDELAKIGSPDAVRIVFWFTD